MVSKFEVVGGAYVFERPAGNDSVVTLTSTTATGGSWSSTVPIGAIIVKGGNGQFAQELASPATSGTFDNGDLAVSGSPTPDISNIQFYCGDPAEDGSDGSTTTPTTTATSSSSDCTSNWGSDWNYSWGYSTTDSYSWSWSWG